MLHWLTRQVKDVFAQAPISDHQGFSALKGAVHSPHAPVRQGTFAQAHILLADVARSTRFLPEELREHQFEPVLNSAKELLAQHAYQHRTGAEGTCRCQRTYDPTDAAVIVGSRDEVGHIVRNRHLVGYDIAENPDGWILERLEFRGYVLEVIRHQGAIAGYHIAYIIRSERNGPIRRS